jgi:hypothetical protein
MVEFGELDGAFADDINHRGPRASVPPLEIDANDDADEEHPASIPLIRAFDGRDGKNLGDFQSAIETTEHLVDQLEGLDAIDDAPPNLTASKPPEPLAANPFDESFGEEEVLVDRYAEFESQMIRRAPKVRNLMDPDLAAQLGRAEVKPSARTEPPPRAFAETARPRSADVASPRPRVILAPVALPISSGGELLLIDDDQRASPIIVPGRQFRRLFTRLEATAAYAQ